MYISELVVEVTRKCNLKCAHCLRGSRRNAVLDLNKFRYFIRSIDEIGILSFGGGEPALAIDTLKAMFNIVVQSGVRIGGIYAVTNGTYRVLALAEVWELFYNYCVDNEYSSLAFSFDHFHEEAIYKTRKYNPVQDNYYKVQEYFELHGIPDTCLTSHTSPHTFYHSSLIKMGRAKSFGHRELTPEKYQITEDSILDSYVYFTVDGLLFNSCDLSYVEMKPSSKFYVGKYTESLLDACTRFNKTRFP